MKRSVLTTCLLVSTLMLHVIARADAALGQANAPVQSHWSFQKPSEPGVRDGAWPRSEVDAFLDDPAPRAFSHVVERFLASDR